MILVFGSLNADLVFQVQALPRPGETVLCPGYALVPGGKAYVMQLSSIGQAPVDHRSPDERAKLRDHDDEDLVGRIHDALRLELHRMERARQLPRGTSELDQALPAAFAQLQRVRGHENPVTA